MKRLLAIFGLGLTACATAPQSGPAMLANAPSQTDRADIGTAVYNVMAQRNLSFDVNDLRTGEMLVKPRALPNGQQRVQGAPERFVLIMGANGCALLQLSTGVTVDLPNVACRPAGQPVP